MAGLGYHSLMYAGLGCHSLVYGWIRMLFTCVCWIGVSFTGVWLELELLYEWRWLPVLLDISRDFRHARAPGSLVTHHVMLYTHN